MNKITIENDQVVEKLLDDSIVLKYKDGLIPTLNITILRNTDLYIKLTSTKESKMNIILTVEKDVSAKVTEIKEGIFKNCYKIFLNQKANLNILKIHDCADIKEQTIIDLNGKEARIDYLLKTVSTSKEKYNLIINHNYSNTYSNIINHGVNIKNGVLSFDVSGFIPKKTPQCVTNQTNRIINLTDQKCQIRPNLFIDENDVIANHSAHIGKFSDEEIFYLQSRGISKTDAVNLLVKGFLFQKLKNPDEINFIINKYWR